MPPPSFVLPPAGCGGLRTCRWRRRRMLPRGLARSSGWALRLGGRGEQSKRRQEARGELGLSLIHISEPTRLALI
eukprot:3023894-Alexandrium_andersonii.AAC.1